MPLKIGLCGLGSAAERAHLPALRPLVAQGLVEIAGVSDPSTARLRHATALVPGARQFTSLAAMLAGVDLDALIIAAPPSAHVAGVRAGLEAGVHVICEKPLALAHADIRVLRSSLVASHGLALVSVHQYEHAPAWQALARVISGAVRCNEEWRLEVDVERPGTDPLSAGGWRAQPEREGGILGDHAVHYLSMLWKVAPQARIVDVERRGAGGRETARISLATRNAEIEIDVSYASGARHNQVRVIRPAQGLTMAWDDGQLVVSHAGDRARRYMVSSLADRAFVNSLYAPFYADVVNNLSDQAWRLRRNQESLDVATMLATALESAPVAATEDTGSFIGDLRGAARAVLLAFADLGVFLGSDRDLVLLKARSLDPKNAEELTQLLDLAIAAELITPSEAGRLRLAPEEARRLAQSLEGSSPVPDDQASAWAQQLGRA